MDDLGSLVAVRLRAMMAEFEVVGNREFGEMLGTTGSVVNNWRLGYNLPRVPEMIRLCEQTGVTLDWLYRGHVVSMDPKLTGRLSKRIEAMSQVVGM
jgi:hypothetical protein